MHVTAGLLPPGCCAELGAPQWGCCDSPGAAGGHCEGAGGARHLQDCLPAGAGPQGCTAQAARAPLPLARLGPELR